MSLLYKTSQVDFAPLSCFKKSLIIHSFPLLYVLVRVHFPPRCRGGRDPGIGGLVIRTSGDKRRLGSGVMERKIEFISLLGVLWERRSCLKAGEAWGRRKGATGEAKEPSL